MRSIKRMITILVIILAFAGYLRLSSTQLLDLLKGLENESPLLFPSDARDLDHAPLGAYLRPIKAVEDGLRNHPWFIHGNLHSSTHREVP